MQSSNTAQRTNSYDKPPTDRVLRSNASDPSRYSHQRKSRASAHDKANQLARDDRGRHEHQSIQGQSPRRPRATLPRTARSCGPDVSQANHIQTGRRPDRTLCASQVPVQLNGFKLESRSHHNFRFHADAGLRRHGHFQSPVFISSSRDRDFGFNKADVRHHSPGSNDSLSNRGWTDEEIFRSRQQWSEKSWRQVLKNQRQNQRTHHQDQGPGAMLTPFCQGQRGQGSRRQEDLSSSKSDPAITKKLLFRRPKSSRQSRTRTPESFRRYGKPASADQVLPGDGFCRLKENYSPADVRAVLDSQRQGRQISGVRAQVGDQSNRWFCTWIPARQQRQCLRQKVLFAGDPRAHFCFWKSARDLRLRPRWLQPEQHQENKKSRGQTYRHSSDWQSRLGSLRIDVGKDQARAGPSRGDHRSCEIKKIWIQQTERQINIGNGDVWPSLMLGLQFLQGSQKARSALNGDGVVIEALRTESVVDRVFHRISTENRLVLWKTTPFSRF